MTTKTHTHNFGEYQTSMMAGTPYRACLSAGCREITLDGYDIEPITHYHVGSNIAGYLPEEDGPNYPVIGIDVAKRVLIDDIERIADGIQMAGDAWSLDKSDELSGVQQDINLWSEPNTVYVDMVDSAHCVPTAFWIVECSETECFDDGEEY